jgi:hypothetical protein
MKLRTTTLRRLCRLVCLACATALAVVAAVPGTASQAALSGKGAFASAPSCTSTGLVIWLDTNGNGSAGATTYNLELTNLSGYACTLRGFPGVSAVDLTGRQLGLPAIWEGKVGKAVTLSSGRGISPISYGDTATVLLNVTDVWNFSTGNCGQVLAAGLRIYPPGQTVSKIVPFPFAACSRTAPSYLFVRTVEKGILPGGGAPPVASITGPISA